MGDDAGRSGWVCVRGGVAVEAVGVGRTVA